MTPRQRINRFLEAAAIPNLTLYLVVAQAVVLVGLLSGAFAPDALIFAPVLLLEGEWWRLFSFMFQPITTSPIFALFALMFLYILGNGLEQLWGPVRFNLFVLTSWALTVAFAFLTPYAPTTNAFLLGGITLAFAWLAPNFEFLMIVIPMRIKWLALFYLAMDLYYCVVFGWNVRFAFLASIIALLLFIGRDVWAAIRGRSRRMAHAQRARAEAPSGPLHTCVVCGKNSDSHPNLDFRYCSKCADQRCYCPDHIRDHEHVIEEKPAGK